jgi:hypothetical protein
MASPSPCWVPVKRAMKFPNVLKVYKKGGRLQETPIADGLVAFTNSSVLLSAQKNFLRTIQVFFQGEVVQNASVPTIPSWLRKCPLGTNDLMNCQVDVTNIPSVRPLRKDGRYVNTPN